MPTTPAAPSPAAGVAACSRPAVSAVGVNHWASHADTAMWSDWREDVVVDDLDRLAAAGVTLLRVFPLWPDFQPIHRLYGGRGEPMGMALADGSPLPNREGLDPAVLDRFDRFCVLAGERNLKLVVGLVTGWMSGRRFVPPGLATSTRSPIRCRRSGRCGCAAGSSSTRSTAPPSPRGTWATSATSWARRRRGRRRTRGRPCSPAPSRRPTRRVRSSRACTRCTPAWVTTPRRAGRAGASTTRAS